MDHLLDQIQYLLDQYLRGFTNWSPRDIMIWSHRIWCLDAMDSFSWIQELYLTDAILNQHFSIHQYFTNYFAYKSFILRK